MKIARVVAVVLLSILVGCGQRQENAQAAQDVLAVSAYHKRIIEQERRLEGYWAESQADPTEVFDTSSCAAIIDKSKAYLAHLDNAIEAHNTGAFDPPKTGSDAANSSLQKVKFAIFESLNRARSAHMAELQLLNCKMIKSDFFAVIDTAEREAINDYTPEDTAFVAAYAALGVDKDKVDPINGGIYQK